jgi:hypothetical protein
MSPVVRVDSTCRCTTRDAWGKNLVMHLSLSRLNHGQPGVQAHPEIMQGTAELHHEIADALLPQADPVFHNATTLDAAVDMLDPQPPLVEHLVGQVLLQGELRTAGLLRRHEDLHLRERERQNAQISDGTIYPHSGKFAILDREVGVTTGTFRARSEFGWCPSIAWMNTHNTHMLALHS